MSNEQPVVTLLVTDQGKTKTLFKTNLWELSASRDVEPLLHATTGGRSFLRGPYTHWEIRASAKDLDVGPEMLLKQFLYLLMRDHLTPGCVAEVLKQIHEQPATFTNPHLAAMAEDYAEALLTDGQVKYTQSV